MSSLFIELLIETILSVYLIFHNLSKNIKIFFQFFSLKSVAKVEMICHKQILSAIATNLLFISSNTICVSKTLNMICKSLSFHKELITSVYLLHLKITLKLKS